MISNLPMFVNIVFILTTILCVFLFYKATHKSITSLSVIIVWLLVQSVFGLTGFYLARDTFPPGFILLALPAILLIIVLFLLPKGRIFIDSFDTKTLTILHIVRVPVELTLYWLFIYEAVPQVMTFEGRNFDIVAGITAPVVYYFGYVKNSLNRSFLITWNLVCLGLLLNIVIIAVLSLPTPFQQFGFNQPNRAVFYFPFTWLPACIVPVVLFAHLTTLRKLISGK